MNILFTYSFQIVAIGTILISLASSIVGSINVYKGQSLIGDAMGHACFAGIVLSFIMFRSKNPVLLMLGAMFTSTLAYYSVELSRKKSKIGQDAGMAIFLSGFFGLGMVLKSYIQGNPNFASASQAGLDNYIFGQAAYLLEEDIYLISAVLLICLIIFLIFYKEIKVYLFDREYAQMININVKLLDKLTLFMTILVIAIGIKSVGAILISSFLIIPTVSAKFWTNNYGFSVVVGMIIGAISSFVGSYISTLYTGFSTGPIIIIISGLCFVISYILGKNGLRKRGV